MDTGAYIELRQAHGGTVRKVPGGWMCTCPAHDDRNPSLSVTEGDDGRVLIHCHAGCPVDEVLAFDGLIPADLFSGPSANGHANGRVQAAVYDYVDERGDLLFQCVRFEPKDFRQRRPDGRGGWIWNLKGVRRVLYRLPAVLNAAKAGRTVYVCEGEKDVHAIERAGAVATCNPMGAGKWHDEYSASLRGAQVVVVADHDEPGWEHARTVAASLEAAGVTVEVMQPSGGKDAADHLAAGRTLHDLVALGATTVGTDADSADAPPEIVVVTLEDFIAVDEQGARPMLGEPDAILIPEGGDVMLYGDGGAGKTTLAIDLAFHLAAGIDWLGIAVPNPVRVLLIENEGPRPLLRHKLKRKRDAWTAGDLRGRFEVFERPWSEFTLEPEVWREQIAATVREHQVDVLIAGPLTRIGMNDAGTLQEIVAFMGLVSDLRDRSGRPLTDALIHHENKSGQVSGAWEGAGDTLLHVQGRGNGYTDVYVQKARWDSTRHGTTLHLQWDGVDGFVIETDRELLDELQELLDDGEWRTLTEISQPKEKGGIGANRDAIKALLEGLTDLFEACTGDAAKALGRSPRATLYRLAQPSVQVEQVADAPPLWELAQPSVQVEQVACSPGGEGLTCSGTHSEGVGAVQEQVHPPHEKLAQAPEQVDQEHVQPAPLCTCADGGIEGDQPGVCERCGHAIQEVPF